ncbi:acyltransferase family protein [Ferruginibacter profundus]
MIPTNTPAAQPKPDFKVLDGLRGIAATYVVINHCRGNLLMGGAQYSKMVPVEQWSIWEKIYFGALQFTALGTEFVIFFFVLSGFSIAYSLRNKQNTLKFYSRRLVRLYPPYITALIWAAVVFWFASIYAPVLTRDLVSVFASPGNILSNIFYIPRGAFIAQFWSLTHEVIFYLLIPFLILRRRYYYWASLAAYIAGWCIYGYGRSDENILVSFLVNYNIYFAAGIWLFHNYSKVIPVFNTSTLKMCVGSILLITGMVAVKYFIPGDVKITFIISALLSVLLIVNFLTKKITNWLFSFLGSMSYTIYITHFATIMLFKTILLKTGLVQSTGITQFWIWPIGVMVCILFSYLIYQVAEKPSKTVLNRWRG